ncbi:MAG: rhamnogalacturonan lyase [Bacteroidales bacterium]|nr:rhamnogalacturonan lyase [Candidatus Liminaster caballi]
MLLPHTNYNTLFRITSIILSVFWPCAVYGQKTCEYLDRSPVAVMTQSGALVSWRSLTADASDLTFSVLRGDTIIASNIKDCTNVLDPVGRAGSLYTIVASNGDTFTALAWQDIYHTFNVVRPAADTASHPSAIYRPDDMSVGDVDGDGQYEYFLKWMPVNNRDNGADGMTSPSFIDCYKIDLSHCGDASLLWRVSLGRNIRSGNHYSPFLVYDLDGDGRAELICKTAPGTLDGLGHYVSEAATDSAILLTDNTKSHVNPKGRILSGEEFLTVFDGADGHACHTIWYAPNRAFSVGNADMEYGAWGDRTGNRGERFNACVAHLDGLGSLPSAIMQRGYYTRTFLWAVDWDGKRLSSRWLHRGFSPTEWDVTGSNGSVIAHGDGRSSFGQGVHSISVGDVDEDGLDEICIGSATIDHDGTLLCSTGYGHGDAIHLGHLIPGRRGLQVMIPHESKPYGYDVHDAATGEILVSATGHDDNGRGLACDFIPSSPGWEFWTADSHDILSATDGSVIADHHPGINFRIYWTASLHDQAFDGRFSRQAYRSSPQICEWDSVNSCVRSVFEFSDYGNPQTINYTKAVPCLQADILGDWREELIMVQPSKGDTCRLMVFTTPFPSAHRIPCLMQDHLYRMGVVWQNSSYNQPPHVGFSPSDIVRPTPF